MGRPAAALPLTVLLALVPTTLGFRITTPMYQPRGVASRHQSPSMLAYANDVAVAHTKSPALTVLRELYTAEEVRNVLAELDDESPTTVLLCGAHYCRLCRQLTPRLHALAAKCKGNTFLRVNHSKATNEVFEELEVQQLPTLLIHHPSAGQKMLPATLESLAWLERALRAEGTTTEPPGGPWDA